MASAQNSSLTFLGLAVVLVLAAIFFFADRDGPIAPVRAPAATTRALEDAVDRLTQAVVRLEAAIRNLPAPGERTVERTVRTDTVIHTGSDSAERRFPPRNEKRIAEATRLPTETAPLTKHFFGWTYHDAIREYGWPDDIWMGDAGLKFVYHYVSDAGHKDSLILTFIDGVVVHVHR